MPTPDTKYRAKKLDTLYKVSAHTGHKLQNKKMYISIKTGAHSGHKIGTKKLDTLYKLGAHTGHKLQNKKNVYLYQNRCPLWTQNADYEKYILVNKNGCPHRTLSMEKKTWITLPKLVPTPDTKC